MALSQCVEYWDSVSSSHPEPPLRGVPCFHGFQKVRCRNVEAAWEEKYWLPSLSLADPCEPASHFPCIQPTPPQEQSLRELFWNLCPRSVEAALHEARQELASQQSRCAELESEPGSQVPHKLAGTLLGLLGSRPEQHSSRNCSHEGGSVKSQRIPGQALSKPLPGN